MVSKSYSSVRAHIIMGGSIVLACFLLFSIDKDTHHVSDLFEPGNIVALLLYALPTYGICALLFRLFSRRNTRAESTLRALAIGIPLSFVLVIALLLMLRPR